MAYFPPPPQAPANCLWIVLTLCEGCAEDYADQLVATGACCTAARLRATENVLRDGRVTPLLY